MGLMVSFSRRFCTGARVAGQISRSAGKMQTHG
eukprot:SAG31_NODE_45596_length_258_cov_0.654088_1_plen_32_part_01